MDVKQPSFWHHLAERLTSPFVVFNLFNQVRVRPDRLLGARRVFAAHSLSADAFQPQPSGNCGETVLVEVSLFPDLRRFHLRAASCVRVGRCRPLCGAGKHSSSSPADNTGLAPISPLFRVETCLPRPVCDWLRTRSCSGCWRCTGRKPSWPSGSWWASRLCSCWMRRGGGNSSTFETRRSPSRSEREKTPPCKTRRWCRRSMLAS